MWGNYLLGDDYITRFTGAGTSPAGPESPSSWYTYAVRRMRNSVVGSSFRSSEAGLGHGTFVARLTGTVCNEQDSSRRNWKWER